MRHRLDLIAPLALAAALGCAAPSHAGTLTVALDHSVRLALAGPAGSVVVGNPTVADVTVVDSHTVFVSGRGPGSTDVTVLDPLGRTLFSGDVNVTTQAGAHVIVHRGVDARADLACDPKCVPTGGSTGATAHSAPAGPGMIAGVLGGALSGAASGAVSSVAGPEGAMAVHPS